MVIYIVLSDADRSVRVHNKFKCEDYLIVVICHKVGSHVPFGSPGNTPMHQKNHAHP